MENHQNGSADGILRLDAIVPARKTILVTRDGRDVELDGWVYGRRCPVRVKAEVRAAWNLWQDDKAAPGAFLIYVRDALKVIVPGLTQDERDALASDAEEDDGQSDSARIMRYLRWWSEPDAEATDAGEAAGEASETSASSSPISAPSMDSATAS